MCSVAQQQQQHLEACKKGAPGPHARLPRSLHRLENHPDCDFIPQRQRARTGAPAFQFHHITTSYSSPHTYTVLLRFYWNYTANNQLQLAALAFVVHKGFVLQCLEYCKLLETGMWKPSSGSSHFPWGKWAQGTWLEF